MKYNILCIGVFIVIFCGYVNGEEKLVAQVGDHTISVGEFAKQYKPAEKQNTDSLKTDILEKLIEEKLMLIDAYNKGYANKIAPDLEKFESRLTVGKLYERAVIQKTKVSPWEIRKWWWKLGTEIKISQMIVKDKSKLKDIYKELRKGKNFGDVARKYTKCGTCGEIKKVKWGELPPELEKIAFSLNVGELSHPIRSGNNLYILKMYDKIKVQKPEFTTEKVKIKSRLQGKKQTKLSNEYLEHLGEIAHSKYNDKVIKQLLESPDIVQDDAVIMTWVGGKFTVGYFLKETGMVGKMTSDGMSRGQFNTVPAIKSWISNKLIYEILLPIEANRHGFDRAVDIKTQLKEREEMLLMRMYQNEEIDSKITVTDEECNKYYQEHRDTYKAEFERMKSRVEWDIKKEKNEEKKKEILKNLRNNTNIEIYEENIKEVL